jgi:hypothetical protein
MTSRLKLWAGLTVLFSAGLLTGLVLSYLFLNADRSPRDHGPAAHHQRIMKRLTDDLSLTAQQQKEIEPIVTRAHVAVLELRFAHQADIEQILARGMTELNTKLTPAQRPELDRMYKGLEQRWQMSRDYLVAQKHNMAAQ